MIARTGTAGLTTAAGEQVPEAVQKDTAADKVRFSTVRQVFPFEVGRVSGPRRREHRRRVEIDHAAHNGGREQDFTLGAH